HKPAGVVSTVRDPRGRPDLSGFLPSEQPGVIAVGRLDRATEGLLILTNDGELANRLMHPRFSVQKQYLAGGQGSPSQRHRGRLPPGEVRELEPDEVRELFRVAGL